MKSYTITVNGNVYDVTVEEKGATATAPMARPTVSAPKAVTAPAASTPVASTGAGAVKVTAPMPGKVLSISGSVGQSVKKGDTILVFEAMKMENSLVAPQDGTIASIDVAVGATFEAGEALATMN